MPSDGARKKEKLLFSLRILFGRLGHLNFRRFEECRTLLRWLEPRAGENILDVGCGDGHHVGLIARSGARVVGIDIIDRRPARRARLAVAGGVELLTMSAEEMTFAPASFDKVISFCVIEHIGRDDLVFQKIADVLKPGGLLVMSADSLSNPGIREAEIDRHKRRYQVKDFYTHPKMKQKLAAVGLEVEDARYVFTTRLALSLVRLSWRMDDLPRGLFILKGVGFIAIWAVAGFASLRRNTLTGPSDHGLTLLLRARKPA